MPLSTPEGVQNDELPNKVSHASTPRNRSFHLSESHGSTAFDFLSALTNTDELTNGDLQCVSHFCAAKAVG